LEQPYTAVLQAREVAMVIVRTALFLTLAVVATGASAQRSPDAPVLPPQPAAQRGPTALDVVVTDKAGHPISGLQQSDFTLLDNGQPTPIRSFAAVDDSASQKIPTQAIVLIDEVNTSFVAVSTERGQIHNFLTQNQGHLPFPVTIIFLTDTGMKQMNQPTTDGNALDAQLQTEQGELRDIRRSAGFYGRSDELSISLKALGSIAGSLAPVPGRKLLVWISPGWAMFNSPNVYLTDRERRAFFDGIVNLSDGLRQARISLYAVNPLGTADAGAIRNTEWQEFMKPVRDANHADPGDLALQVLSIQSGGQVFYGNNDIAGEIAKSVADGSVWYQLTFDMQRADSPNAWHSLEIKLDKPGLKVRTRNGYYAKP
jgi:VWFA-related protein